MESPSSAPLANPARGRLRRQLATLCAQLVPGSRLLRLQQLGGGVDAVTHRLDLLLPTPSDEPGRARCRSLILRRYGPLTLARSPQAPLQLSATLTALGQLGLPAPRPLWLDAAAATLDVPALLVDYLPGRARLPRSDWPRLVRELATLLVPIHAVSAQSPLLRHLPSPLQTVEALLLAAQRKVATGSGGDLTALQQALSQLHPPALCRRPSLIHGDYWAGNVVGQRGRLQAVVDWDQAACGDGAYDVAYCRVDLALLFGPAAAAQLRDDYERISGVPLPHLAAWDLIAATRALPDGHAWLPGYAALGRSELTVATLSSRLQQFLAAALREFAASSQP